MEFLRIDGKQRWFLYLHMMDVHEYTYDAESARFGTVELRHLRQRDPARRPHRSTSCSAACSPATT